MQWWRTRAAAGFYLSLLYWGPQDRRWPFTTSVKIATSTLYNCLFMFTPSSFYKHSSFCTSTFSGLSSLFSVSPGHSLTLPLAMAWSSFPSHCNSAAGEGEVSLVGCGAQAGECCYAGRRGCSWNLGVNGKPTAAITVESQR